MENLLLVMFFIAFILAMQGNRQKKVVKKEKKGKFPNGFESWYETYFLVCEFIVSQRRADKLEGKIEEVQNLDGSAGMFSLSKKWTDEFESIHKGEDWSELDFYDEVEKFCKFKNQ